MNFSSNSLKASIDFGFNEKNQDLAVFLSVVGKALHVIASFAPFIDMFVRNILMWSIGLIVLLYDKIVGSLKPCGGVMASTSCMKGGLPNISKFI